jgi:DNA polymerase (family 10)
MRRWTCPRFSPRFEQMADAADALEMKYLTITDHSSTAHYANGVAVDRLHRQWDEIARVQERVKVRLLRGTESDILAMRLPLFKIWGHALGRLLLEREPIAVRVDEVLEALAASRGAVEINGDPRRLDLPPQWARKARERGLKFVLSVDAHSTQAIGLHLPFAVAMARRAGIRKGEVLNALPFEKFRSAVKPL